MLIEMHAHTSEHSACSIVSAVDLVRHVHAKGLQGIVLTDHHYFWSDEEITALHRTAGVPSHFLILPGQEVTTDDFGDVLVYGADRSLHYGMSMAEIRGLYPDAALVWAHPYRGGRIPPDEALCHPALDGVEIFNSNHTVRGNSRGLRDWHRLRFTAISGTDTHGVTYAGTYPTLFDHPFKSIRDIAVEIRAGRCRPFLKEIPHSGANTMVTEVTFGTKGSDEVRERIIIRSLENPEKWQSADRAFHIMEEIAKCGFDSGPYRIPRPIDEDPSAMTLIEEGLRGKSLFDKIVASPFEEGKLYLQMTAQWLARLHNCRLHATPPEDFITREETKLNHYIERFDAIAHPHRRKAREIMEAVYEAETPLLKQSEDFLVQGHGDFHPKNIFIGQDIIERRETLFVAAIDFESSHVMPQAFDVGCFLAQFRNQFFRHQNIINQFPDQIFLDAYCTDIESLPGDFLRQTELFRARTNLGIAAFLIKIGLGASEDLWRVLVEAERALTHL